MKSWIDRNAALALLGVKAQTLYAYVSRGRIRMEPDRADARRSLYHAGDIDDLVRRRSRGRKAAAIAAGALSLGEPTIPTGISTSAKGRLFFKGQDAVALAQTAPLEHVASLLWEAAIPANLSSRSVAAPDPFAALACLASASQPSLGRGRVTLIQDAGLIVGSIANASGASLDDAPLHQRLVEGWGCDPTVAPKLREALVLMADHDLTASTFAVRVAASTGASLAASILAGLCALSGPRHGGAPAALSQLIAEAARDGVASTVDRWLNRGAELPGFGHPLYPDGDPRAVVMLEGIVIPDAMKRLVDAVFAKTGLRPNCDFGLVAISTRFALPQNAPFSLFLIGRSVGWCAHAMEQSLSGQLIRPRGRYQGPVLAID
ncbi:citrate synthase [Erythrobacteraceae bacterium CFH 75059]|uniref:citrate synthase n=1 Tax=Qipengyuania thermophila TaxID=2509361 RepID=UPI001021E5F0|nr:citrate synthase [Qipengyuania thermophila]TCD06432.1 citrate synthase [Erythrobacteraceae bacterium CFH 75059]